jgi:hypothetical protein
MTGKDADIKRLQGEIDELNRLRKADAEKIALLEAEKARMDAKGTDKTVYVSTTTPPPAPSPLDGEGELNPSVDGMGDGKNGN